MYKYIALTALVLGSAALGFNINRGGEDQFTLALAVSQESPDLEDSLVIDVNQDGIDELVRTNSQVKDPNGFELQIKFNEDGLHFGPWVVVGTYEFDALEDCDKYGSWATNIKVVSLNGDSYPDLVVQMTEVCIDNNGGVDVGYGMLYFINNGSGGFTCAGDVTEDGTTDVKDLLGVIGDWGCIEEGQPD